MNFFNKLIINGIKIFFPILKREKERIKININKKTVLERIFLYIFARLFKRNLTDRTLNVNIT